MHHSSTVRARQLGATLKQSRETRGMRGEFVAAKLGVSTSKISRLESGQRSPKFEDVAGLLALYGVTGQTREDILKLCREAESGETGWWQRREMSQKQRTLIELESSAAQIVNYEPALVPGLLQTGEYARAVIRDIMHEPEEQIEKRMVTRLARHSILMRGHPPRLVAIVHESTLRLAVGGYDVLGRQLRHLLLAAQQPYLRLRVIPESVRVHPGLLGSIEKIDFADAPSVMFLENRVSSLFLEDEDELSTHDVALNELLTLALSPGESRQLLAKVASEPYLDVPEETVGVPTSRGSTAMAKE